MENQHQKIKGYRDLSQEEIDLMNEIKSLGQQLESLLEKVKKHIGNQIDAADGNPDELFRINDSQPGRWVSIAATDLQTGLMALTRSVAQPTIF